MQPGQNTKLTFPVTFYLFLDTSSFDGRLVLINFHRLIFPSSTHLSQICTTPFPHPTDTGNMFGFIADILTSITSILFPIFASYKALRTSDPAVLTPWLMYWTTLSLFLLVESQLSFILYWVPFYSWMRLGMHLYLVLPGKQGSVYIYQTYIHPFLEEHERQIDHMISDVHEKARAAGMDAVKRGVEYVRVNLLGQAPSRPSPPPSRNVSYSTQLFNRFAMPSARESPTAVGMSDLFGLLGRALQQSTYQNETSQEQARDLAESGTLIPPSLSGAERESFVNTQRERLRTLLQAFDTEAFNSHDASTSSVQPRSSIPRQPSSRKPYPAARPRNSMGPPPYMHQSHSESEFEDLGYETMPDPQQYRAYGEREREDERPRSSSSRMPVPQSGAGWSNWIWGSYGEKDSALDVPKKEL